MKLRLWPRRRPPAPSSVPSPAPAAPLPVDKLVSQKVGETNAPLKPLEPLKPLLLRPRAHAQGVDMVAATAPLDAELHQKPMATRAGYVALEKRYPKEPIPVLKRYLLDSYRKDVYAAEKSKHDFETLFPSRFDRVAAWCDLYCDREYGASHRAFRLTLREMLEASGAHQLMPAERQLLLRRENSCHETLVTRAVTEGTGPDLQAALEFAQPSGLDLRPQYNDWLTVTTTHRWWDKSDVLLRFGARPQDLACWRALAAVAVGSPSATLLRRMLACGLDPNLVLEDVGGPWALIQGAADADDHLEKVQALVLAGATLTGDPAASSKPSAWRTFAKYGPEGLRQLVELGWPINGTDPHTGNTPLMDLVHDNRRACIEPALRLGADPHIKRIDGLDALSMAVQSKRKTCTYYLKHHGEVAPWIARLGAEVNPKRVDVLGQTIYEVPPQDIPTLVGLAENLCEKLEGDHEAYTLFVAQLCAAWEALQFLAEPVRQRVLLRLRANDTVDRMRRTLAAFCHLPADRWDALLDHLPWYVPKDPVLNQEVLAVSSRFYAFYGAVALDAFDLASYTRPDLFPLDDVTEVLKQFVRVARHGHRAAVVANWGRRQIALPGRDFTKRLQERVERFVREDVEEEHLKIPVLPKRRACFTFDAEKEEAPHPVAENKQPQLTLQPVLAEALGHCPTVNVRSLNNLPSINVEEVERLIKALQDPDVEDDIIDFPQAATATVELIEGVLNADTLAAIFADKYTPNVAPTRAFFLACHPDKVGAAQQRTAIAMTQLLNTIRALIKHETRGSHLSAAFWRSRPEVS